MSVVFRSVLPSLPSPGRRCGARALAGLVVAAALAVPAIAGCSDTGINAAAATASGPPVDGGVLQAAMVTDPDHLDPALSYTTESWEILEATNDGLVRFAPRAGAAGNVVVPDLALSMPTVSADGLTYTFHLRTGIRFSPPVNRDVEPTDVKASLQRLFLANSPGEEYYTEIAGANEFAKTLKGGLSGVVADNRAHTLTIHLTTRDGTFLDYLAMPFADVLPEGAPATDVSTDPRWRVATGPYMVRSYVPKSTIVIARNPNFRQWTANTPNGHLAGIDFTLGVSAEQAVNEVADGGLQFYSEQVAPDRLASLRTEYPSQVHNYVRSSVSYFSLNMRKPPMNNLKVREALNDAVSREALLKIFGGQGVPTENIVPPGIGGYAAHDFYRYDLAKARRLVDESGTKGMTVQVWASDTDPQPAAAQYVASVLQTLGYHAIVKTLDEGIYYDTVSAQATNPQVSYNEWDQDFPEADDFIEGMADGAEITNVGNNDTSNLDVGSIDTLIDTAKAMPLGPARNALWARLDAEIMGRYAAYLPFVNRTFPKFEAADLHGQVFNNTFYELFPSMWISR